MGAPGIDLYRRLGRRRVSLLIADLGRPAQGISPVEPERVCDVLVVARPTGSGVHCTCSRCCDICHVQGVAAPNSCSRAGGGGTTPWGESDRLVGRATALGPNPSA